MILHVTEAKYLRDYVLWVRFNDGMQGEVDLRDELDGEVFEPLKDQRLFRALRVDPVLRTVVWPNAVDLAPEFLHDMMKPSACAGPDWADSPQSLVARESQGAYETKRKARSGTKPATGMNPRIVEVSPEKEHRLRLRFQNGEVRIFNCTPLLDHGVFRELADDAYFRRVRACDGTVCWPHEQDICPDTLYMDSIPAAARTTARTSKTKGLARAGSQRGKP
jgi:hypothetical protein